MVARQVTRRPREDWELPHVVVTLDEGAGEEVSKAGTTRHEVVEEVG